ncbi:hypothetical protein NIES4072_26950 [Nostoc commune NIES-4072]|uniref:Uncharacterized protein n=1 Tax=Nostoc commune NIES-4072 TaxID=2005467 RepID=A0A2R5FLY6_NOSCO|nr:hypothetical protein [Nostoc commune]BBD69968.1 hypothetical protein NIES4070_63790 [Nostoc commune HK-02]GBG19029.1 hypothetical protein NIES4072_26950 [Nostoc commune NIES-4072]
MTNKQQDMINLLNEMYCNINYSSPIDYFLDIEFLDGEDWVHLEQIEVARLNLILNGRINELKYTEDELREYIQKELKALSILIE